MSELNKETKELLEKQGQVVNEIRKEIDEKGKDQSEKLDKMKEDFVELEKKNQDLVTELELQKKLTEEQKEAIDFIEKKFARFPSGADDSEKKAAIDAFVKFVAAGRTQTTETNLFGDVERKYLRTDKVESGEVLVPETLSSELLKQEIQISPILANAKVLNVQAKAISIPIRTTIPTTNRPGEGGTSTKTTSSYEIRRIEAYRNDVITPITRELLKFANFDMVKEMTEDAAISLAEKTNIDFITGDAVSKSEGILTNADVGTYNSGIADAIDTDNFMKIQKQDNIKTKYRQNGKFYMNSNTLFDILADKDGTGQYLWNQNLAMGLPNTIAGRPYVETPNMPDVAANAYPVFFGDLAKAYYILRTPGVELIIDEFTQKTTGIIEYMWVEFIGGKVVLPEAIVKLKVSA
jgi:HK97 family phage major capsid protein